MTTTDVLCQLPIGVAISRYGVRRVLMAFQGIQLVGTLCFALAPSLVFLHVGRILIGLGSSVTFIGFVTVIKQWFPPQWGGGLMGASITCGVTGASVAQVSARMCQTCGSLSACSPLGACLRARCPRLPVRLGGERRCCLRLPLCWWC